MYLVMHAVGESLKFASVDTYSIYEPSIMMSEDLLEDRPNLWCDFTANDLVAIANAFPKQDEPQFTYQWSPNVEITYEQAYLLTEGINYTLTISSNATCCTSSTGTAFGIDIKKSDSTSTNGIVFTKVDGTSNKFNVRIDNEGQYMLTAWVNDGNNISGLHQQTVELSVLGGVEEFVFNAPDTMLLHTPYKVNYVHTAHPTRTVEYSIREIMFDNGTGRNATLVQSGDSCTVTLNKYGCYVLNAIVKENGQVVARKFINMTKMLDLPNRDRTTILLDETNYDYTDTAITNIDTLSSYSYCLIMPPIPKSDRFACLVESEYEIRNGYSAGRRIDRRWFLKLNLLQIHESTSAYVIQIAKRYQLPTLYKLIDVTHTPIAEGFTGWRYEYYTGRIYIPLDGMRMVNSNIISQQPLGYINIQTEGFTPTRVGMGFE